MSAERLEMIRKAAKKVEKEMAFKAKQQAKSKKQLRNATASKRSVKGLEAFDEKNLYVNERELNAAIVCSGVMDNYYSTMRSDSWD